MSQVSEFRSVTVEKVNKIHELLKKGWSKTRVAKEVGISRRGLYNVLEVYPKPIKRVRKAIKKAEIGADFKDLTIVKDFARVHKEKAKLKAYLRAGIWAYEVLKKKHPSYWTQDDFRLLWGHEVFRDPQTGKIRFQYAVGLRRWMDHLGIKVGPEFTTKGLKRPPARQLFYLKSEEELVSVIMNLQYPDTLALFRLGTESGARHSSLKGIRPIDIDPTQGIIIMREPKVQQSLTRYFNKDTIAFIERYIEDMGFKGKELIFPRKLGSINADLKQAGERANIPFDLTSHVALKHTFVSLASNYGVSLEVVSEQTGTDPQTLRAFYVGIDIRRMRSELLGERYRRPDFHELIEKLEPFYNKRYAQVREALTKIDGLAKKPKKKAPKKKKPRKVAYTTVEALLDNEKTPENIRRYWERRIKEEGKKDHYMVGK